MKMCIKLSPKNYNYLIQPSCSYSFSRNFHHPNICKNLHSNTSLGSSAKLQRINVLYAEKINKLDEKLIALDSERIEKNNQILQIRLPIIKKLNKAIWSNFPNYSLVLVGSLASGLAIDENSDLDLALLPSKPSEINDFWQMHGSRLRHEIMRKIIDTLILLNKTDPELKLAKKPSYISNAYVPIILCKFLNGISMDIQLPRISYQSLRNTLMVKEFVMMDPRFSQIFYWLNQIFTQLGIKNNNKTKSMFSSYQTLMLILHFLNHKDVEENFFTPKLKIIERLKSVSLPHLIRQLKEPVQPLPKNDHQSKYQKCVGKLTIELIDYWHNFNPSDTIVHIETGQTTKIIGRTNYLLIFDPFEHITACRSPNHAKILKIAFKFLNERFLSKGLYINDFPEHVGITEDFLAYANSNNFPLKFEFQYEERAKIKEK